MALHQAPGSTCEELKCTLCLSIAEDKPNQDILAPTTDVTSVAWEQARQDGIVSRWCLPEQKKNYLEESTG